MTTKVQSNVDGSSDILVGAVAAIHMAADGTVWLVLKDYASDAAAAAGGVPIGGMYRTGAVPKCRTV